MNAADIAALVDLVKRYGSMIALVNVSAKPWRAERQAEADDLLRRIIDLVSGESDDLHDLHPQPGDPASPVPAGVEGWAL